MEPADEVVARRIGRKVGDRWTLERLLGTGGMAAVYAARDDSGAEAAIKILHPEMSLRRDVRERFLREAYLANKVGHPGAVGVQEHFDGGEEQAFLVMELLRGEPLSDRVRRQGTLPVDELLDHLDQVLDVLVAAHDQGIVHRDLKPDNLFVTEDGRAKILDFGVARLLHDAPGDYKTRTGMALGTLPYMAPEQALGRRDEIDGRADLFSLGATAFRILTGRKVHEADSDAELLMAMAAKPAPPLASVAPSVPPDVCAVVDLALAFSKDARYPDARTMQKDVRAIRRGESPPFASGRLSAREQSTRLDMRAVAPLPAMAAVRTPTVVAPPAAAPVRTPTVVAPPAAAPVRTPTVVAPPAAGPVRTPTVVAPAAPNAESGPVSTPTVAMPALPSEPSHPPPSSVGPFVPPQMTAPAKSAPQPTKRKSSASLFIALGVLAVVAIAGAAAFVFAGDAEDSSSSETEPAALPDTENAEPGAVDPTNRSTGAARSTSGATAERAEDTQAAPTFAPPASEKRGKGRGKSKRPH